MKTGNTECAYCAQAYLNCYQTCPNSPARSDDITLNMASVIEEIIVERNKKVDSAILGEIQKIAVENGLETKIVLNEKNVAEALRKQIPEKPIYVDTRFRNHGRRVSDGSSLAACYKCPNCQSHIFHVFDSEHYCVHCGQALDWSKAKGE